MQVIRRLLRAMLGVRLSTEPVRHVLQVFDGNLKRFPDKLSPGSIYRKNPYHDPDENCVEKLPAAIGLRGMAILAATFLLAIGRPNVEGLDIAIGLSPLGDGVRLEFDSDLDSYYIALFSSDLADFDTAVDMVLGTGLVESLTDTGVLNNLNRGFYIVEKVSCLQPFDTDEDGIHDVFELERIFLDPLDPGDAGLDFDGDFFTNYEEFKLKTDLAVFNASVPRPQLVGLGLQAAKDTLGFAGLNLGDVEVLPIVQKPAVSIVATELDYLMSLPVGATIDVSVSFPGDPNLFIDQRNIAPFDGTNANADAYYAAIDPLGEKTTLSDWKAANGFDADGANAVAAYFNEADLGFGREMYMRHDAQHIAYYVTNYRTANEAATGDPIAIATVAMEFSPHPINGGDPYVKFYTFNGNHPDPNERADPTKGIEVRLQGIDLDGRGAKPQPGMCMTCHGGVPKDSYPGEGRIGARFIPFDVDSFTYSTLPGFSRAEQEAEMKKLNGGVLGSLPSSRVISYTGPPEPIPDATFNGVDTVPGEVQVVLPVHGLTGVISDLDFFFQGLRACSSDANDPNVGLAHTFVGDLDVYLTSPEGTTVHLLSRVGGSGTNFCEMRIDDEAFASSGSVGAVDAPFSGTWAPAAPLSAFDGENANGDWTLTVVDRALKDLGTVNRFSLDIATEGSDDAVEELIHGWYGGAGLPASFDASFVPSGWMPPTAPADAAVIYSEVLAKSCRACHVMLTDKSSALDFNAFPEFQALRSVIKETVFEQGLMPMAKQTFEKFWKSCDPAQAELLAEWIGREEGSTFRYTGPSVAIPDAGQGPPVEIQLDVTNLTGPIEDLDFSFDGVGPSSNLSGDLSNGLTHTFVGDLVVTLTSPTGTSVVLLDHVGGYGNNFGGTRLDDEVSPVLASAGGFQAPFPGSWAPSNPLDAFRGLEPNGTWTLTIEDTLALDTGSVQQWSLHFNGLGKVSGPGAAKAFLNFSVNAPIPAVGSPTVHLDASTSRFADSVLWELVQVPPGSSAAIGNPEAFSTSFAVDVPGIYEVRVTVGNGSGADSVTRVIEVTNQAPQVTVAAEDQVLFPIPLSLEGHAEDDGIPDSADGLTYRWEKSSGSGTVTFVDAASPDTIARFSAPGTYTLCLTADDGLERGMAILTVEVGAFSTVGHAGNAADTATGHGSVGYEFRIGKYEVTNSQYSVFLNAVATASDPFSLYHDDMGADDWGGIVRSGSLGGYVYTAKTGRERFPVTYVSFIDAVRYANWLHNGAVPGGDTEDGAYTLLGGTEIPSNARTVVRNSDARFWIPSEDEWYKAAYHQPESQGGDTDDYWNFATRGNAEPASEPPPGTPPAANYNYIEVLSEQIGPTEVGAYVGSESYYGTSDQSGNVWELTDTITPEVGNTGPDGRVMRGSSANNSNAGDTLSYFGAWIDWVTNYYGFRVAASVQGSDGNLSPVVNAGADVAFTPSADLPAAITLAGSVSDDGLPGTGTLTSKWAKVSGPGEVTFDDDTDPGTTVHFEEHGDYVLSLTGDDGELSAFDVVEIKVLISFSNDIAPIFGASKANCIQCHNAILNSGMMNLDVEVSGIHDELTVETPDQEDPSFEHRAVSGDSGNSLIILKPQGNEGHGGGPQADFTQDSIDAVTLWINQGLREN